MFHGIKQFTISAGVYRPARAIHRAFSRTERNQFKGDMALFRQFVRPGDLCYDIGANIGAKTEVLLSIGASVIAFEPQPKCARELRARCGHFGSRLTLVEKALGEQPGKATLHLREADGQASLLSDWIGTRKGELAVEVVTADQMIAIHGLPRFCKIDVEGAELLVLRGLSQTIPFISIECHTDERCVSLARECLAHLSNLGMVMVNATAEEGSAYLLPEWLPISDFLDRFPDLLAPYAWGDLYVTSEPGAIR